jgi:hypothetical protein
MAGVSSLSLAIDRPPWNRFKTSLYKYDKLKQHKKSTNRCLVEQQLFLHTADKYLPFNP